MDESQFDPSFDFETVKWVRKLWQRKLILKGIMHVDDARLAVDVGADAIIVSNHGGRQLDGAPSSISVLPEIAAAVRERIEVFFDGGIRTGSDIVRAMGRGAHACLTGRAYLYGLAAKGRPGVTYALKLIEDELNECMALTGLKDIGDIPERGRHGAAAIVSVWVTMQGSMRPTLEENTMRENFLTITGRSCVHPWRCAPSRQAGASPPAGGRAEGFYVHPWRCAPSRRAGASPPSGGRAVGGHRIASGLCAVLCFTLSGIAGAEVTEVQIARGFAIPHLPIMIMEHEKLLEKHALAAGLPDMKVVYSTIGGGAVMNDALISGALAFGVGGPPPMLTLWDKTRSTIQVKGVCAEATMPLLLNTRNPNLKTVKDLTEKDKIAVGAVKVSIQAVLLQMAAAKEFGQGNFTRFDALTVGMNSPDATAALRSGAGEVNTNFSLPPFQYAELKQPGIHTLASSNDIMGGPHTFTMVYTTTKFHDANPRTYNAFLAAIKEAIDLINRDKSAVARTYIEMTRSKESVADIVAILDDPQVQFTMAPAGTMKFADFMFRIGSLKNKPNAWQDYFFEEIHNLPGS